MKNYHPKAIKMHKCKLIALVAGGAVATFIMACTIFVAEPPATQVAQVEQAAELSEHDKLCAIADKVYEASRRSGWSETINCNTIEGVQQLIPLEDVYYPKKGR